MSNLNKRNPIAKAIKIALFATVAVSTLSISSVFSAEEEVEQEEHKVIVTGSRLKRTDVEGPAPITVITSEDIEANGFTTAFEALKSLTIVNGGNQGAQDAGTFTQGADSINLRAIGPGRTLTLINGRRVADYPLPFNGQSNIVNVANVPAVMIERIEILPSGASAIYGSDAMAGVVNIILKDEVDGTHFSVRAGDTYDGGGESYRLEFVDGIETENLNLVYGVEYFKRTPIFARKRDYIDSVNDNPDVINGIAAAVNSRSFLILDPFDGNGDGFTYIDPGAATCDPLSNLVGGTIEYSLRPGVGRYCGTGHNAGYATIRNAKENVTAYLNMSYQLNSSHELYSTFVYNDTKTDFDTGVNFWQGDSGGDGNTFGADYFLNQAGPDAFGIGGQVELWQRIFTPEEVSDNGNHFKEEAFDFTLGARGEFFGGFDYDVTFTLSQYDTKRERRLILQQEADDFFFGEVVGQSVDFGFGVWNIFDAPHSNMYRQLTHAQFESISSVDTTNADSQNMTFSAVFTNEEIFEMPAGYAGLAVVVEAASQEYDVTLDPRLLSGTFFGFTGSGGGGERDRTAIGFELQLPIIEDLSINLASRFDNYDDETNVDGAATYNVGIEYRPFDNLLLRGTFATNFRAPDMHYVYADPNGFFTSVNDEYLCRRDDLANVTTSSGTSNFTNCTLNVGVGGGPGIDGRIGIEGAREGSLFLEEEEGESTTIGFVYNIMDEMSLSIDYYQITIENGVRDLSLAGLVTLEANCRLGQNFAGTETFDINSPRCQNAIASITRNPVSVSPFSEIIDIVTTGPINAALREVTGYDLSFNYSLITESMGGFNFDLNYNITDKDESQQSPGDDVLDRRSSLQVFDLRSSTTLSTSWVYEDFGMTWFARRTGSLPNWAETGRCCERTLHNLSATYQVTDGLRVGVFINNVLDENPQVDSTFNSYPYYDTGLSDAYGREYSLQFDYKIEE